MIDPSFNLQNDLSTLIKSLDNLPSKKKLQKKIYNLQVKDCYLDFEIPNISEFTIGKTIQINKNNYGETLFKKILSLIEDGCINCLIKINQNWFYTSTKILSGELVKIKIQKRVSNESELHKIYYLLQTVNKLKSKLIPQKRVRKYIFNYFEYLNEKTNLKQISTNKKSYQQVINNL